MSRRYCHCSGVASSSSGRLSSLPIFLMSQKRSPGDSSSTTLRGFCSPRMRSRISPPPRLSNSRSRTAPRESVLITLLFFESVLDGLFITGLIFPLFCIRAGLGSGCEVRRSSLTALSETERVQRKLSEPAGRVVALQRSELHRQLKNGHLLRCPRPSSLDVRPSTPLSSGCRAPCIWPFLNILLKELERSKSVYENSLREFRNSGKRF